jgi:hypothetical protein
MLIYEICCAGKKYRGKTDNWQIRKSNHKSTYTNPLSLIHNIKVYKWIRENGGWCGCSFNILETDLTEEEACIKEGEYIRAIPEDIRLNIQIPGRTDAERKRSRRLKNGDEIREKERIYRELNKDHYNEYGRKYCKDNRAKRTAIQKKWREKNKDKYYAKIECPECKLMRSKRHMKQHYKKMHPLLYFNN